MTDHTMKDQLTTCPKCNCDGCYVTPINEVSFNYFCWGCGFQTNDLMIQGEFNFEEYELTIPELYKDIKYKDEKERVWYPITINLENKGTVFLNGTTKKDVHLSAIKSILLTEEEKKQPKYKDKNHKSDPKSLKHFGNDFIEACDYIGVFEN